MHCSIKRSCILFFLLGLWWVSPIFAETLQSKSPKPESDVESTEESKQGEETLSQRPVPFAQYEETLKNSEQWKSLSPEEQKEALDKIKLYRKLFRRRQTELQKQYKPLLEQKPKKRSTLSQRRRDNFENTFEDVWGKWHNLPSYREKELSKRWGIPSTLPSKRRAAVLKVWKKLLPATRQKFLRDLR